MARKKSSRPPQSTVLKRDPILTSSTMEDNVNPKVVTNGMAPQRGGNTGKGAQTNENRQPCGEREPQEHVEPETVVHSEPLTASQKKNAKRREKKKREAAAVEDGSRPHAPRKLSDVEIQELDDSLKALMIDPNASERQEICRIYESRLAELKANKGDRHGKGRGNLANRSAIENYVADVRRAISSEKEKLPKSMNHGLTASHLVQQAQEMEAAPVRDEDNIAWIREQVKLAVVYDGFRAFKKDMESLIHQIGNVQRNASNEGGEQDHDRNERRVQRLMAIRRKAGIEGTLDPDTSVDTKTVHIPGDCVDLLFGAACLARHLEQQYRVVLDRSQDPSRKTEVVVTGLEKDVPKCVENLACLDLSSRETMRLNARTLNQLRGRSQAALREVEMRFGVLVHLAENGEVSALGPRENTAKAAKHLMLLSEQTSKPSSAQQNVVKKLKLNPIVINALMPLYRRDLMSIGTATQTTIRVVDGRQPMQGEMPGTIMIRGVTEEAVDAGTARVMEFVESFTVEALVPQYPENLEYAMHVCERWFQSGRVAVVSLPDTKTINIVGTSRSTVELMKQRLETAMKPTKKVWIHQGQLPLWSPARRKKISEECGVEFTTSRFPPKDDRVALEISGTAEAMSMAEKAIIAVGEAEGYMETEDTAEEKIAALLANGGAVIREIERSSGVLIKVIRGSNQIRYVGAQSGVGTAKTMVEAVGAADVMTEKTMDIRREQIPMIIGRGGAKIREIKAGSKVQRINIDDESLKLSIRGSETSIEKAQEMVREIVSNAAAEGHTAGKTDRGKTAGNESPSSRSASNGDQRRDNGKKDKDAAPSHNSAEQLEPKYFPSIGESLTKPRKMKQVAYVPKARQTNPLASESAKPFVAVEATAKEEPAERMP